jgi:hypothetical protein
VVSDHVLAAQRECDFVRAVAGSDEDEDGKTFVRIK